MHDRPDLDGVLAFMVLVQDGYADIDQKTIVMPILPITLCWGGGHTADLACQVVIEKSLLAAIYCAGSCRLRPAVWTN